jgi:hypothetical protein
MVKEEMLEIIKKNLKGLPDRKTLKHEDDILGKHKFTCDNKELDLQNKSEFYPFNKIPKENILF